MACPAPLGSGVTTKLTFCDVLIGRDPAGGILITIPPHRGDVKLTFDLHNRHTFSEEQMKRLMTQAGLVAPRVLALPPDEDAKGPSLFAASAQKI